MAGGGFNCYIAGHSSTYYSNDFFLACQYENSLLVESDCPNIHYTGGLYHRDRHVMDHEQSRFQNDVITKQRFIYAPSRRIPTNLSVTMRDVIREYYALVKPGIIYGNAVSVVAGFFLASHGRVDARLFVFTLVGISLVIACGCVINNYIDRDIDALMVRTKNRPLVRGTISGRSAVIFGACLGIIGTIVLATFTNYLTVLIALGGLFAYLVLYSLWSKRHTVHATLIGAISGAVPPVVGYCAVSNNFDVGAVMLFLILFIWQLPHALSIAIYRYDDYSAASIPVLPISRNIHETKLLMTLYTFLFLASTLFLSILGFTGYLYMAVIAVLGIVWLILSINGFNTINDAAWARKMFFFSLIMILSFTLMIVIDTVRY